ncbi:hypothetical protein Xmau_00287 [Xenorhabdus mauleonii]|uniref:Uncharacterized protein n=1 Tax=Xenorhabdus mauleonii TaxID=351675 RepID=A0A1I3U5D9_9GAMM|nr:hypothetical protein Xmau_00287 [Xenorhabdus mauleonii]SFJ77789.1 hypothetical protein SAMN05421680_1162 [Xenorhabdus mauleonii]
MKTSRYPTRADAARANLYSHEEPRKLSEQEIVDRMRKFDEALRRGDKYFKL